MFNTGFRGKRASDGTGIINPQEQFVQNKYPVPTITSWSISGTNDTALNPAGGQTVLVNGGGFVAGCAVTVNGVTITPVTVISPNQISFTSTALAGGSYTLIVYNSEGGGAILVPGLVYSSVPTYTTGAGSIGSGYETTAISTSVVATSDSSLTYAVTSGALPAGASMTSGGVITGTYPVLSSGSSETFYFDITATDAENQDVTRSFTLTTNIDVVTWVTPSSGATINLDGTAYSQALSATDAAGYSVSYTANALPTGLTLSSGTISGTPTVDGTSSTLLTATAATTNRTATNTITWVVSLSDVYFKYSTMLLSANSSIQTSSFVSDNSINNAQLTVLGDTRASNFNPYQHGYYSNYFDGTGDYLTVPSNQGFSFGTGDFTVECWVYYPTVSNTNGKMIIDSRPTATNGSYWLLGVNFTGVLGFTSMSTGGVTITDTVARPNQWVHYAAARQGTSLKLFANGTQVASTTDSSNISSSGLRIGMNAFGASATDTYWLGYISNVRIVKGTALYTSAFTPSTTPLAAVSGTSLLTSQSNRLIDNSINNFTITKNGDTTVSSSHPFSKVYQAGTQYYSNYFDGTGDYLTVPYNSAFDVAGGSFTVESWINMTGLFNTNVDNQRIGTIAEFGPATTNVGWEFLVNQTANEIMFAVQGVNNKFICSYTFTIGQWYHIAVVRNGSSNAIYVNGIAQTLTTNNYTGSSATSGDITVGTARRFVGYTHDFLGNISNLRIIKGTAVYTSNFTPATTPLTAVSGTSLLTCQDSTFKDNSSNNFTITSSGDAKPLPVSPFTPSSYTNTEITTYGSGYFDGSGDYLSTVQGPQFAFGTGDYTIEAWVYRTDSGTQRAIVDLRGGSYVNVLFYMNSTNQLVGFNSTSSWIVSTGTIPLNQWAHVAITRSGTSAKLFINGVVDGTATNSDNNVSSGPPYIGRQFGSATNDWLGYIEDVRVIKGSALYTSNFVPQFTSPLTNVTNTRLLTLQTNGSHNNSTFKDSSSFNNVITRNGNVTNGTFSPYGDNFSVYFGTTAMGVQTPASSLTTIIGTTSLASSSTFTIEAWINQQSRHSGGASALGFVAGSLNVTGANADWGFGPKSDGKLTVWWWNGSVIVQAISTNVVPLNTWTHIATTISSGAIKIFINGVEEVLTGTTTVTTVSSSLSYFTVGGYTYAGTTWQGFNGYISNLRVVKSALYSTSFTPSTTPLTAVASTSLLLFNSNRFTDSSVNSYALTVTSTPTVQKFSPFGTVTVPKYYSSYFDGATDYLKLPISTSGQLGSGNFTVECWVYLISKATSYPTIFCNYTTYTSGTFAICYAHSSGNASKYSVIVDGNFPAIYSTGSITYRQWTHLAVARSGSTVTFYIDGVVQGTYSSSATLNGNGSYTYIGSVGDDLTNGCIQGYVSNLRVVVGTAIYTSAFTPSTTPLTAVSGTTILTCQNNTFVDNSTNANVITANGDVKPLLVSPFTPTISTTNLTYNPTTFGGSMYFDGTGDYLTVADSTSFDFPGNFTMEAWVYPTALSGNNNIISQWTSGLNFIFKVVSSGRPYFAAYPGGTVVTQGTTTAVLTYQWNHVAVTRSGTTIRLFVNGIQDSTTGTVSGTIAESAPVYVGSLGASEYWSGYITDLKVINGTALYVNSFSPGLSPSTPTTTVGSTIYSSNLLLSGASGGVIDATRTVDLETVADSKVTNFSPYNGTNYSVLFDGSSTQLASSQQILNSNVDVTVEAWIYPTGTQPANGGYILSQYISPGSNGTDRTFLSVNQATSSIVMQFGSVSSTGTITLPNGVWTHVAWVRSGNGTNNWSMYVNGVRDGQLTYTGTYQATPTTIGGTPNLASTFFNGYISNLRLLKGTALYSGTSFSVPTQPLTAITNTALLICQSNKFIDNSTNAYALSVSGTPKVATQNPFQVNTGQSYYFDGTGDVLSTSANPANSLSTGDFTVEAWVYTNTVTGTHCIAAYSVAGAPGSGVVQTGANMQWLLSQSGTNLIMRPYVSTTDYSTTIGTITIGQWTHIAMVRSGNNFYGFVNGVKSANTQSFSNALNNDAAWITRVGLLPVNNTGDEAWNGYISDLRITKGYARYTTTFTPPTTPYKLN